jgi:hypothetical protein
MAWLIRKFSEYKNQVTHKTDADFVEQFAVAIDHHLPGYVNIGQLLLDEQVKRARRSRPLMFGEATQLAAGLASKETVWRNTRSKMRMNLY